MALLNRTLERPQAAPKLRTALRVPPVLPVVLVAVVALGLVRIVQSSDATTTNYSIQELGQQRLEARTVNSELEADIATLSSLDRIQQEAERLGFAPPAEQDTLAVNAPHPAVELPSPGSAAIETTEEATEERAGGSTWLEDALDLLPFR